jgi:hypothetical protein
MSKPQDTVTNEQTEAGEGLKDVAQSKISSTDKDALRDGALDDVAGGTGGGTTAPIGPHVQGG